MTTQSQHSSGRGRRRGRQRIHIVRQKSGGDGRLSVKIRHPARVHRRYRHLMVLAETGRRYRTLSGGRGRYRRRIVARRYGRNRGRRTPVMLTHSRVAGVRQS